MFVIVLGSINIDLVTRTSRLPALGETITGLSFTAVPGGKGANQAVAAAQMGVPTAMIGCLGDDSFGRDLHESLAAHGIDLSGVVTRQGIASGVATITIDDQGQNCIIVVPGANATLGAEALSALERRLPEARVLLLQLEVPLSVVSDALKMAHAHGTITVLDPAPIMVLPDDLFPLVDVITPNEVEAAALVGFPIASDDDAARAAQQLLKRGVQNVILKRGGLGIYWASEHSATFLPALKVTAVDTVAAGDAFNGALAAALAEGQPMAQALRWGVVTAGISVTRQGAQSAMPTRAEVTDKLQEYDPG